MARLSLLTLTMTSAVGCLDAPPEYSEPTRNPPVIQSSGVHPSTTILNIYSAPIIEFDVPFRADDVGLTLQALFVLDQEIGPAQGISRQDVDPDSRPFAEQDRVVTYPWTWEGTPTGCHTMTAIITESDNISQFFQLKDVKKQANVTWFLLLTDSETQSAETPLNFSCFTRNRNGAAP
ncbi:MAG TPA: hypothetical protein VHU80_06085 [Polyangiaceae bacterium]|jgi:hypothetical protein|nr:hypothetical protein [Polyangiaceae bacterium]